MGEKRRHRRFRKRLRVNYGEHDLLRSGFTGDLSEGGLFIVTNHLEMLDTRLHLQLILDPQRLAYFESVVTWRKDVPVELRGSEQRGFGVRFLPPHEVVAGVLGRAEGPLAVRYTTPEELKAAYAAELKMGGVFVSTARVLSRDQQVTVRIELVFAAKAFEFAATVLHVSDGTSGKRGVAVAFQDHAQVRATLLPLLT